ncbi:Hypp2884 [Branchiostoma lanceolatum]|uniref:Hypp2884 protein n=1 Tax=Branchiostoma lanceolatum TaxID=7740 RepID=A0A8K0EUT5_BRALA|nr:Hypp2884 [Branchiostoma lanceolatum]
MRCHGDAVGDKRLTSRRSTLTSLPTPLEVLQKIRTSKMVVTKASTVTSTETSERQHSVWSSDSESESSDDESCWCLECFKCRIMGTDVPHEDKFAVTRPGGDHKKTQSSSEHGRDSVGSSASPTFFNGNDSSRHGDKRTERSKRKRCSSDSGADRCKRIELS